MRSLLYVLATCLAVGVLASGQLSAKVAEKVHSSCKILGTWKMIEDPEASPNIIQGMVLEFHKGGKGRLRGTLVDEPLDCEFIYEIKGDTITIITKDLFGNATKDTASVTELTDKEMVLKSPEGTSIQFTKKR